MEVLIAEDDPITLDTPAACISGEGFHAITAKNGSEALALWEKHRPHLLCLDIMMPEMDEYEVCRRVRAKDATTLILFLSAKNEEVDVVIGLEIGADDFIRKRFTRGELTARIRAALPRVRVSASPRTYLEMRGLRGWPEELRAERDGSELELTP